MMIEKSAGEIRMVTFTDGAPISVTMAVNDVQVDRRLSTEDLHDLIYVAQRMLAQIEEWKR